MCISKYQIYKLVKVSWFRNVCLVSSFRPKCRKPPGSYKKFQGRNSYKKFVGFLVDLKTSEGHFEIKWPLAIALNEWLGFCTLCTVIDIKNVHIKKILSNNKRNLSIELPFNSVHKNKIYFMFIVFFFPTFGRFYIVLKRPENIPPVHCATGIALSKYVLN